MRKSKDCYRRRVAKKLIRRLGQPVCPGTGSHFKAKWGDSLNAERLAIFAKMPSVISHLFKNLNFRDEKAFFRARTIGSK